MCLKNSFKIIVCCVVLVSVVCASGCKVSKRRQTGKFSDDEIASYPLAQRRDLPSPSGGMVLSVGSDTISSDEIVGPLVESLTPVALRSDYEDFVRQAAPMIASAVRDKVVDVLLYQKARNNAPDNIDKMIEKAAEGETSRFVARYDGNYAEAEKALKRGGMDWKQFKKYQGRMILTQSFMQQEIPEDLPVTHGELIDFYNMVKLEKYQQSGYMEFRLIDIDIEIERIKAGVGVDKEKAAIDKANAVVDKIAGGEDFGELAKTYSHGHKAAAGGLWQRVSWGSLAEPYDILESLVKEMPVGQFTGPIEHEGHLFIIKLEGKQFEKKVPFEDVQQEVEAEVKLIKRKILFDKMITGIVAQANIPNMEGFMEFCVDLAYRKALVNR